MAFDLSPLTTFLAGIRRANPYEGQTFAQVFQSAQDIVAQDAQNIQAGLKLKDAGMQEAYRNELGNYLGTEMNAGRDISIPGVAAVAAKYDPHQAANLLLGMRTAAQPKAPDQKTLDQQKVAQQGLSAITDYRNWYGQVTAVYPDTRTYLPSPELDVPSIANRLAILANPKGEGGNDQKPMGYADLYHKALGAFKVGKYLEFYNDPNLSTTDRNALPNPGTPTDQLMQTLVKGDIVSGATLANDIAQSGFATTVGASNASNASVNLGQNAMVKIAGEGEKYAGIPQQLESQVQSIKNDYAKFATPPSQTINETDRLIGLLGDGSKPVTGTPAIAAVFAFMKGLDPTSTVRESEFDSVAGANGLFGKLYNFLGKLDSGITLTDTQAKEMIGLATKWKEAAKRKLDEVNGQANSIADKLKIQRAFVTGQSPAIPVQSFDFNPTGKAPAGTKWVKPQ